MKTPKKSRTSIDQGTKQQLLHFFKPLFSLQQILEKRIECFFVEKMCVEDINSESCEIGCNMSGDVSLR